MAHCYGEVNIARGRVVYRKAQPQYRANKQSQDQHRGNQLWKATRMAGDGDRVDLPDRARCPNQRERHDPNTVMKHLEEQVDRNQHVTGNARQKLGPGMLSNPPEESVVIHE